MEFRGTVGGIYVAPESAVVMRSIESVEAVAGEGLRGDRYFRGTGRISSED